MASSDAGLTNLVVATYSGNTYTSLALNGNSWISTATQANTALTNQNFTIEFWVNFTDYSANSNRSVYNNYTSAFAANNIYIGKHTTSNGNLSAWFGSISTSTFSVQESGTPPAGWNHYAVTRNGANVTLFRNGIIQASNTGFSTTAITNTTNFDQIGGNAAGSANVTGAISGLRILKGQALYSANFTPNTSQFTAISNTVLLTAQTSSSNIYTTFIDTSSSATTITNYNASYIKSTPLFVTGTITTTPTFSTANLTYNVNVSSNITAISLTPTANDASNASLKFNSNVTLSSGNSLIASSAPYYSNGYSQNFVSGMLNIANATPLNTSGYSWTIEMWVYPNGTYTAQNDLFAKRVASSTTTAYQGYLAITTGYIGFYNGTAYTSTYVLPPLVWSHVAYTYDGNAISIFVNGYKVYGAVVTITDNSAPLTIGGAVGYTDWMLGNISNFRFTKGYQLYTSTFTPPTQPLSLTQSSSTGVQAITGAPTNGYSGYFNGTNSYLSLSDNAAFQFGTSNFTMEAWVYPLLVNSVQRRVWSYQVIGSSATIAWFGLSTTNKFTAELRDSGGTNDVQIFGTSTPVANTWYHVAFTRVGTTTYLYVNGILETTTTGQSQNISSGGTPAIGSSSSADYFNGYITNVRIIKGNALYSLTNFAPSLIPLTPIANTSLLALQNSLTTDASTNNFTLTNNNVTLSTAFSPFSTVVGTVQPNGSSVYFNGSTSLSNSSVDFTVSGDFTIECWIYPTVTSECDIFKIGSEATGRIVFGIGLPSAGNLSYNIYGSSSVTLSTGIGVNTWQHVAFVRRGTTITGYVNGVSGSTPQTLIGTLGNTSGFSTMTTGTGYITNLRYVIGTALYTANFNVYNAPLVAITNTKLLLLQSSVTTDASTNNYTITPTSPAPTLSTTITPFIINGASSTQFSGSLVQYLATPNPYNPSLTIGAASYNNFTAEAWIYMTALPPATPGWYIMQKGVNATYGIEWSLSIYANTTYYMLFQWQNAFNTFGTTNNGSSNTINLTTGQWNHIAITKVGGTIVFWFNGKYAGSINGVINLYYSTNSLFTIANTQTGATTAFNGYINNARVVYGAALYTVDYQLGFTPNSTNLTTTQSVTATTAAIQSASSYTNSSGYSVYFNNSTDYLTFTEPTSTTNDVTIEAWVMLNAAPTTSGFIINNNASSTGYFGITINTARTISVFSDSTSSAVVTSTQLVQLNQWTHIAVVFNNSTIYIYINGVKDANSVAKITTWGAATPGLVYIGRQASAAAQYFPGYMTNVRMVYGTALYLNKFTVPTSPFTAITNTVFLGLQSSATTDASTNNYTVTKNGTGLYLSTMTSPFSTYIPTVTNGYSLALGWQNTTASAADYLTINTGYVTSTQLPGDFTIEVWMYMALLPATQAVIIDARASTTDAGYAWYVTSGFQLVFFANNTSVVSTTITLYANAWNHLAISRQNGLVRQFVNGALDPSTATNTTDFGRTQSTPSIGRSIQPYYWSGYLSNFRLIIGKAIYTGAFKPSANPLSLTTSSGTNIAAVNGITTYASATNPYGINYSGSLYFGGGTTGVITAPNSGRYELATYDFTIEAWFYSTASSGTNAIVTVANTSATTDYAWALFLNRLSASTGTLQFTSYTGFSNATVFNNTSATLTINTNQWYHIAAVRIGTAHTIYLNGVSVSTASLTSGQYLGAASAATLAIGAQYSTYSNNFYGYISNVRVVRGYGVYTGNFTPSTSPLTNTQASGTNIIALNSAIPSLGNSVYFNGTTDYMKAPSSITTMSTGDFTIETYYYPTSFAAVTTLFGQYTAATTGLGYWNVQVTTAGIITVYYNGSTNFTASTAILINEWVHIALVRISGTITLYVNGVSYGTASFATQFGLTSVGSPLYIGATQLSGPTQYALGYMSNLRITKGLGVYTGAFTVPTTVLGTTQSSGTNITAITGTSVSLLMYQNSLYGDNSTFNYNITAIGNPQYSPIFSPSYFSYSTPNNGNSGYFNGTNSYLSLTQPSNASTNDFTIELWVYPTSITAIGYLLSTSTTAANCYHLWIATTGAVTLAVDSATASITSATPSLAKVNTWTHIAVTRTSGVVYLYVNGYRQATTLSKSTQFGDTGTLNIGRYQPSTNQYFTGYITNIRYVYGTPAVYTGNPYSTPPYTTPLTAITNTTLLLLQSTLTKDNSTNNVTVTNNNAILSTYTNPYAMMQLPVVLTGQSSNSNTTTTGIRDNSVYNATITSSSLSYASYQTAVSLFGVTPALLLAQSINNLYNDNSINNYSLTPTTTVAFSPTVMPYVTPFNSNNAVSFAGNTQGIIGTNLYNVLGGDFTIEFFMMAGPQLSSNTYGSAILTKNTTYNVATNNNYYIMCNTTSNTLVPGPSTRQTIQIYNYGVSTINPVFMGLTPVCDSKWHHVAIVRISNIVSIYIDGVLDSNPNNGFTNTGIWDYNSYAIGGGGTTYGNTALAYSGLLSNMRIINGKGIYTGTFAPPTSNLTTSQSVGTNITAFTPTTPSSTGYSLLLNSVASSYLTISAPSTGLNFGLNDYTIEFWHFLASRVSTTPCFFSNYSVFGAGGLSMFAGHSSVDTTKYQVAFNGLTISATNTLSSNSTIIYGKWTHIALVRRSGTTYLYINGVLDSSTFLGINGIVTNINNWYIAATGDATSTSYLNGFISNFRVTNGIAVYSGTNTSVANFTVPSSALSTTQGSGTNISAISNSLVTNGGAVAYSAVNSQANITSGQQYINSPYNTSLPIGNITTYTIEMWVYLTSMPSNNIIGNAFTVIGYSTSGSNSDGIYLLIGSTLIVFYSGGTAYNGPAHNMSTFTWYHLAMVRNGTTITYYVNGIQLGSSTGLPSSPQISTTPSFNIGGIGGLTASSYNFNGYMSNIRITKGKLVYTGTFTPTTSPLAITQNAVTNINAITGTSTSALVLQSSNVLADASTNNFTVTIPVGVTAGTSPIPFATGYSVSFNTNQYATLPSDAAFTFGTGNFTIECWIYLNTGTTTGTIFDSRTGTTTIHPVLYISSTVRYAVGNVDRITGSTITALTWYHIALVRISGSTKLYVNGIQSGSTYADSNSYLIGSPSIASGYNSSNPLSGYISNLRIVKGLGVYLSQFSSPTASLTATQSATTSINAITRLPQFGYSFGDGTYTASAVPGPIAQAGSSIVNSTIMPIFQMPADFTIEAWVFPTSFPSQATIFDTRSASPSVTGIVVQLSTTGTGQWTAWGNITVTSTANLVLNTWQHIAVVRITGTITLYLNGTSCGSGSTTQFFSDAYISIGTSINSIKWVGSISNVRMVKGLGIYTGAFTVPTSPLSNYQSSGTNIAALPSPSSAVTNGYSVLFNGTTDYLRVANNSAYQFGSNNFTIECWFYTTSLSTNQMILSKVSNKSTYDFYLILDLDSGTSPLGGQLEFYQGSTVTTTLKSGVGTVYANVWYHVAITRNTSTYTMFLNGVSVATTTSSNTPAYDSSNDLNIGVNGVDYASNFFNGYITNVRIVNGVNVYSAAFSPQLAPLQTTQANFYGLNSVTGTQTAFLGLQTAITTDSSTNNATITSYGTPTLSTTVSPFVIPNKSYAATATSSSYLSGTTLDVFSAGTTNWTLECWFYNNYISGTFPLVTMYTNGTNSVSIRLVNGAAVYFLNGSAAITAASASSLSAWHHVAVVRNGTTTTLFVDGASAGTTTGVQTSQVGRTLYVFYDPIGTIYSNGGQYITNIRFVKDISVYTGTFTVPTSPLTATQSSGTNISAIASSANTICIVIQDALTDSQGYYTLTVTSNFYLAFNVPASPFSLVTVPVTTLALQSTLARDNSLMNIPFTGAASGTTNRSFSPFGNGVSLLTAQSSITADNGPDGYTITNNSAYYETAITPFGLQTPVTLLMAQTSNVLYDASGSGVSIGNAGTAIPVNIVNGPFNNDPTLLALQGSVINDSSNNLITSTMYSTGNTVITTDNGPFTASKSITSFLTNTGGYNDVSFANAYIAIGNTANASTAPTANIMMNPFTITSSLVSVLAMQSNTVTTESSLNNLTITTLNTAPTISATSPFGTYYANGLILLNSNINSNTNTVANTIANILVTAGDAVTTNNYSVTIATTAPNLYSNTVNNDYKGANYVLASSYVTGGIFDSANVYILAESLANANSLSNSSSFIITTFVSNDALASINNGLSNVSQANANFFISDIANSNLAETLSNANIPSANYTRSTIDSGFTGSLAPSPVGGIVYLPTYSYTDGVVITAANVQNSSGSGSFATNTQIWYQG